MIAYTFILSSGENTSLVSVEFQQVQVPKNMQGLVHVLCLHQTWLQSSNIIQQPEIHKKVISS